MGMEGEEDGIYNKLKSTLMRKKAAETDNTKTFEIKRVKKQQRPRECECARIKCNTNYQFYM